MHCRIVLFMLVMAVGFSCKKLIGIDPPRDTITDEQIFGNNDGATDAITGIYSNMINTQADLKFASGGITVLAGLSADEFIYSGGEYHDFHKNTLLAENNFVRLNLWKPTYFAIYQANACIQGLTKYDGVTPELKKQLTGEAKFLRAFCFFYLVNLYGGVPLALSTDWEINRRLPRASVTAIYDQIIADLIDAKEELAPDYHYSKNERTRVNRWAAISLLARCYLYNNEWRKAEAEATEIIEHSLLFNLEADVKNTFAKNSREVVWQLEPTNKIFPYAIPEAFNIIPQSPTFVPLYALSPGLMNSFENGDLRKQFWCDSTGKLNGTNYFYPSKYKTRFGALDAVVTEYYTVIRLAELYLARAEARAKQNNLPGAISDVNTIRRRAGLTDLPNSMDEPQILSAIAKENRTEFFSEWGHRWFNLKRTGKANEVLGPVKGSNWQMHDMLYPIPVSEMLLAPQLTQNPGY